MSWQITAIANELCFPYISSHTLSHGTNCYILSSIAACKLPIRYICNRMYTIQHMLTHWGRVTHICVGKLTIIGSDNGLSPGRRQAIIWTNAEISLIEPFRTNFSEILIGIQTFSFKKMHLKMSSAKWRPFCFGLNELKGNYSINAKSLWQSRKRPVLAIISYSKEMKYIYIYIYIPKYITMIYTFAFCHWWQLRFSEINWNFSGVWIVHSTSFGSPLGILLGLDWCTPEVLPTGLGRWTIQTFRKVYPISHTYGFVLLYTFDILLQDICGCMRSFHVPAADPFTSMVYFNPSMEK